VTLRDHEWIPWWPLMALPPEKLEGMVCKHASQGDFSLAS